MIVDSIRAEYRRYKALGEGALVQVSDNHLSLRGGEASNSIAVLVQHIGGNLRSRFTDFLTSDGEKPWRQRDQEFEDQQPSREELLDLWDQGWRTLFEAVDALDDDQLGATVTIRGVPLTVAEALHRSLAHTAYHVGQIVDSARQYAGDDWESLSIPRGGSETYNQNPTMERFTE